MRVFIAAVCVSAPIPASSRRGDVFQRCIWLTSLMTGRTEVQTRSTQAACEGVSE